MRRLLGVENAIFNLTPLTLKLGLSKETSKEAVTCEQSEAKQLEMILLHWREAHKNTDDFAVLRKVLEGFPPEGKNAFFTQISLGACLATEDRLSFLKVSYPRADLLVGLADMWPSIQHVKCCFAPMPPK